MPKHRIKEIPEFKSEDEERDFWDNHDLTDYFNFMKPVKLNLSKLKPSTHLVTSKLQKKQ